MKIHSVFIFLLTGLIVSVSPLFAQQLAHVPAYLEKYNDMAIMQMQKYKIPVSIILAQGILESNWGRSVCATQYHNHFGVKAGNSWKGKKVNLLTKEYRNGKFVKEYADFRRYDSTEDAFEDHSLFLKQPRYSELFLLDLHDYSSWAYGLKRCGYATDPQYAEKLIRIIENYNLSVYDRMKYKLKLKRSIYKDHDLVYILANEGDNLEKIASDLNMKANKLQKYNELPDNFTFRDGDIIYLEKKHSKAHKPYYEHIVIQGQSAYQIAQMYGMQLKTLYRLNKQTIDAGLIDGDVIRLR
ncbi:MAG: glucosaminidase domain-containing protein [Candidatus Symbiothrix sp.]|jgi:LysM repeat protein|nr:glucosaminidase domain-containing protein [Candidatus Symbiothrix sp.]